MSHPDRLAAVLDANVLYPQWLRDVMLTLAAMGYFDPVWSQTIIDEMRRNVLADHPDIAPDRFDAVTIAALRQAFPDAWVHVDPALIAQMDNAPGDRHVLATAVASRAQMVVTANITDLQSARWVDSGRIVIETPSTFLTTVLDDHQDLMADALYELARRRRGVNSTADVLHQLDRHTILHPFVTEARTRLL